MAVLAQPLPHIDSRGLRAVVWGTDIKVSQIADEFEHLGMTVQDIVEAHPHLTLGDVHAALAYYYDHPDVVRRDWAEADELVATLKRRHASRLPGRCR